MDKLFDLTGKTAVITGGTGILCSQMAKELASRGAKTAILGLEDNLCAEISSDIKDKGGESIGIVVDVLDKESLTSAKEKVINEFGSVDILVNGAGGNKKDATTSPDLSFFDLPPDALQWVFNLNFLGTVLTTQVFGETMVKQDSASIINVSSMASLRPLTNVMGYAAAKAAINNFTQWLAVHFNLHYSKNIRVNAIAPGFFLTNQNRFLLTDKETGEQTQRGKQIIEHTPMGRYGTPEDLLGTIVWLSSNASAFVNGTVIPVDGGFAAYSGV